MCDSLLSVGLPSPNGVAMTSARFAIYVFLGIGAATNLVSRLNAQSVKQGEVSAIPRSANAFRSPMIIETAFPGANSDIWKEKPGTWFTHPEWIALGKYTCDGVSLRVGLPQMNRFRDPADLTSDEELLRPRPAIKMKVQPKKDKNSSELELTFEFAVINPKANHDKIVSILIELLDSNGAAIQVASLEIKARDNAFQTEPEAVKVPMNDSNLKIIQKMRLTVTTENF